MKAAFFETVSHLLSYLTACLNLHQDFLDFLLIQSPLPDFYYYFFFGQDYFDIKFSIFLLSLHMLYVHVSL